jgi:hypothetical protein
MTAQRAIDETIPEHRSRLGEPLYAPSTSKPVLPEPVPGALNNLCRRPAREVLERLDRGGARGSPMTGEAQATRQIKAAET